MHISKIDIPSNEYNVFIGKNVPEELSLFLQQEQSSERKILIVTDSYFKARYALNLQKILTSEGFTCFIYEMKGGKGSKTFNEVLKIYGVLEVNDFARDSCLIALGGGVIGDLAGFVASTWYRGMKLIHMPTTLMSMIDSSIGGKVAINFRETINAVGNYYHPIANFMDLDFIQTLSDRDYVSGIAEIIKCAVIADSKLFHFMETNSEMILKKDIGFLVQIIDWTIKIKVDHVKNDIREGGKRLLLNFGHTLGHAIEMSTQTKDGELFRHGEGVSLGMIGAMYISEKVFGTPKEYTKRVIKLLTKYGLPVNFSASEKGLNRLTLIDLCFRLTFKDKKRKHNKLRFVLSKELGEAQVSSSVEKETVLYALNKVIES